MDDLQTKEAVRQRDGYRCTDCGITQDEYRARCGRRLDVHRLQPSLAYTLAGCATLCRRCHRKAHRRLRETKRLARVHVEQAARLAEKAYRRGFQHGHLAAQGKLGAKAPTDRQVYDWRFARYHDSVSPPGSAYAGAREPCIERAITESLQFKELWMWFLECQNATVPL